jgi:hypothetical protein
MKIVKTIVSYLSFASTWKGIIGMLTAAGVAIAPEVGEKAIALGLAAIGFIQVFIDDQPQPKE